MVSEIFSLRSATAEDVDAIRSLTREAYAKWVPVIGREPLPMTADYVEAVKNHKIDFLYYNGDPVALIEMIPRPGHLLIENVAVSPAFQGKGLGQKLLAHAEKVAASLGYSEIRLYTNKRFSKNLQFYHKLGYCIDREEQFMGGFTVHMSKPVRTSGEGENSR